MRRPAEGILGMDRLLLLASWVGIFLGLSLGALQGLRFAEPAWLGGYGSWERRMLRLAHISLIALPLLNFASLFSASYLKMAGRPVNATFVLLLVAQVSMPTICALSALDRRFRHLFAVPVVSLLTGAAGLAYMTL